MSNFLKSLGKIFIGESNTFDMESRIFHYVCVFSVLALLFNIPLNNYMGLPELSWILLFIAILISYSFYLSRWKYNKTLSVILFGLTSNTMFVMNFFYGSGSEGTTLLFFILSFFLTISVAPKNQYLFWITINVFLFISLLAIEYYYPEWVKDQYETQEMRYIDISIAYTSIIILVIFITDFIRRNYHIEKDLVEAKAKELEYINDEKDKLFSIVAHDLRAPFASIQNYLELLTNNNFSDIEKNNLENNLLKSTENINEMLNNLLFWAGKQMKGVQPNLQLLNLLESLNGTLKVNKSIADHKSIDLKVDIDPEINLVADANMLQLIIRNLVNNAIKFTDKNGKIIVKSINENGIVGVSVSDTGIGISPEDLKQMFSYKVKSKQGTNHEKGFGLGLVLCKEYVLLQHGNIRLESVVGEGTTFFVEFKKTNLIAHSSFNRKINRFLSKEEV